MTESTIVHRFEVNGNVVIVASFVVFVFLLFLIPTVQLTWVSDSLLKWVSDFCGSLLKWFSNDFLPRFTEFTSSTILALANPLCLLLYMVVSFLIACWTNWFEVKTSVRSAWSPFERAAVAIYQLFSNPQTLIQYALLLCCLSCLCKYFP